MYGWKNYFNFWKFCGIFSNLDNIIWLPKDQEHISKYTPVLISCMSHLLFTKKYMLVQDRIPSCRWMTLNKKTHNYFIIFKIPDNPCLPTTNNFYIFVNVISCWLLQHSYLIYRRWNLDMTVKVFAIKICHFFTEAWNRYKGNFSKKIFDWLVWISSTVHLIQLDIRRHNYFILESYVSIFGLMLRQNHYYLGHKSISRW